MSPRYTRPYAPGPYGPILLAQHLKVGSHFYLNSLCIYNTYSMSVYLSYLLSMTTAHQVEVGYDPVCSLQLFRSEVSWPCGIMLGDTAGLCYEKVV